MSINIPTAHKANVSVPFGELSNIVQWCENNCTGEWRFTEDIDDQWNSFRFFFESERDYVAFLLCHR